MGRMGILLLQVLATQPVTAMMRPTGTTIIPRAMLHSLQVCSLPEMF